MYHAVKCRTSLFKPICPPTYNFRIISWHFLPHWLLIPHPLKTFKKHLLPVIFLRWQFVEPALFLLCHSVLHINMHIGGIHVNVVDGYNSCFQPEDFGYINYKQKMSCGGFCVLTASSIFSSCVLSISEDTLLNSPIVNLLYFSFL